MPDTNLPLNILLFSSPPCVELLPSGVAFYTIRTYPLIQTDDNGGAHI
jgi:hypothetical protein